MKNEIRTWRTAIGVLRNSERICQHHCVLAVLREAISLGCIVLFCSSVVQAQAPVVPGTALANPTKTIRSSQGTSDADNVKEKKEIKASDQSLLKKLLPTWMNLVIQQSHSS